MTAQKIMQEIQSELDQRNSIADLEAEVNQLKTELRLYKQFYEASREAHAAFSAARIHRLGNSAGEKP